MLRLTYLSVSSSGQCVQYEPARSKECARAHQVCPNLHVPVSLKASQCPNGFDLCFGHFEGSVECPLLSKLNCSSIENLNFSPHPSSLQVSAFPLKSFLYLAAGAAVVCDMLQT